MRRVFLGISILLIFGTICFGQKQRTAPVPENSASSKDVKQRQIGLSSGTTIEGRLQSALDVKRSRVGDEVVLKTTKSIRQDGQVIVPKGTNLIGRITEVQQRSKENSMSRIGMVFDRIEGKNLNAPITASIMSVTNVGANNSIGETLNSDLSGSSSSPVRSSGGGSGGGGLLGGVGGTVGGVVNTATQTVGGVTNTATQAVGNTTQGVGRTINGLQISQSASGSAQGSTTLSSGDKNLRLDKGVMFQLRLDGTTPE
jgi:hypothetical protein